MSIINSRSRKFIISIEDVNRTFNSNQTSRTYFATSIEEAIGKFVLGGGNISHVNHLTDELGNRALVRRSYLEPDNKDNGHELIEMSYLGFIIKKDKMFDSIIEKMNKSKSEKIERLLDIIS